MASYQKSESFPKTPGSAQAPWRIAVYIRLSKDDGNDESLSITNQKRNILKLSFPKPSLSQAAMRMTAPLELIMTGRLSRRCFAMWKKDK